jgi:hypothetical protein
MVQKPDIVPEQDYVIVTRNVCQSVPYLAQLTVHNGLYRHKNYLLARKHATDSIPSEVVKEDTVINVDSDDALCPFQLLKG